MKQVIVGGVYNTLNVAATEYNCIGTYTWNADPDVMAMAVSTAGKLKNLRVELDDVPGTGTYTFTLYRRVGLGAWGDTALTCIVAADGTVASDTTHEVTVAAGDMIALKCVPDSPDNARNALYTIMFEGDTANESLLLLHMPIIWSANRYGGVSGYAQSTTESWVRHICPTSGKIKNLHVQLKDDPGTAPDAYRFVLRVNGADSDDGEGNALECTITADDKTGNDTTHEITVSAGDILTVKAEPLNAPTVSTNAAIGMTFVADTDGESLILGGGHQSLDDTKTEYNYLAGFFQSAWTITETQCYQLAQGCTLKKLYMLLSGDPGGTDKYTFTVRLEGASPGSGLVVEIAGGSTTGNDTTNSIAVSDGEVVNMMVVPTDTPVEVDVYWGLVGYIRTPVDYSISTSTTLTASASIDRDVAWDRATSPGLTAAVTIVRQRARTITTNTALAISTTIARALAWGRATAPGLTVSATIARALAYARATLPGLTAAVTIVRQRNRTIVTSSALAISATIYMAFHTRTRRLRTFVGRALSTLTSRNLSDDNDEFRDL